MGLRMKAFGWVRRTWCWISRASIFLVCLVPFYLAFFSSLSVINAWKYLALGGVGWCFLFVVRLSHAKDICICMVRHSIQKTRNRVMQ